MSRRILAVRPPRLPMRFLLPACFLILFTAGCLDSDGRQPPQMAEEDFLPEQDDRSRMVWQQPGAVLEAMGDIREKVIADIGAGEGFFATRLAPYADRVIAVEIDDSLVNVLREVRDLELPKDLRVRLDPRLARPDDPLLDRSEVDIILFVNTLMYIDSPLAYLQKIYPALRPDGRIVIVDWKRKDTDLGPPKNQRLPLGRLQDLLREAGFHVVSSDDATLEYQYIVVADKKRD